jgi:hypothetical protein
MTTLPYPNSLFSYKSRDEGGADNQEPERNMGGRGEERTVAESSCGLTACFCVWCLVPDSPLLLGVRLE